MNSHKMIDKLMQEHQMANDKNLADEHNLVPVHVSWDEVKYLNLLQGSQSVDEETGIREYGKLSTILKNPEIRNIFIMLVDMVHNDMPLPPKFEAMIHTPVKGEDDPVEPIESDFDKDMQAMYDTGEGKDKVLVMMPQDVVRFLDFLQRGEKKDPTLHLQEFWSLKNTFKSVVRVVGTVGGALVGGPFGAAIGNALAHKVTGAGWGKSFKRGIQAGAGVAGHQLAGPLGAAIGAGGSTWLTGERHKALANALKAGASSWGANSLASSMGGGFNALSSNGATGSAPVYGPDGKLISAAGSSQAGASNAAINKAASQAVQKAATPSIFSKLSGYALPAAILGGAAYFGQKGEKQREDEELKHYNEDRAAKERSKRHMAELMGEPLYEPVRISDSLGSEFYKKGERVRFDKMMKYPRYKTGGKIIGIEIKGKGTGQSDEIYKTVPENSWVWDATTVAHLGDGATDAGHKAIESFEKQIKKNLLKDYKPHIDISIKEKPLRAVPCALSNGERVTPPHLVAAIGKGSFDHGSSILRRMTKELRRHKASNGNDLPPAAHRLEYYYKKAIG